MRRVRMGMVSVFLFVLGLGAEAGTGITAYGSYWDTDDPGYGLGIKYSKSLVDMIYLDGRVGYIEFDDEFDTSLVPLEAAINLGFPGFFSPYVGVGAGYYVIDHPTIDDKAGVFGQVGVEVTIVKIGVMAELRYLEIEGDLFDELSVNAGIVFKF